tara:strand:+ start:15741 stop:16472 length:732 start_codon:yes stop_codon:yes gene_type:complete
MKIALQLSGQPRGYKKAHEYLHKNFLQHYDVDIFFHTWEQDVYPVDDIMELYNPKRGVFWENLDPEIKDVIDTLTNTPNAKQWPPSATFSSFYSIWIANQLRMLEELASLEPYDYVMRTRFDFALNVDIKERFDELRRVMDSGSIIVPSDRGTANPFFCNDQWSFGNSQATTEYCSTYTLLMNFYKNGVQFNAEDLLSANLKRIRGNHRIALLDMNHPFPPGPYNGSNHSLVRDDMERWKTQN